MSKSRYEFSVGRLVLSFFAFCSVSLLMVLVGVGSFGKHGGGSIPVSAGVSNMSVSTVVAVDEVDGGGRFRAESSFFVSCVRSTFPVCGQFAATCPV